MARSVPMARSREGPAWSHIMVKVSPGQTSAPDLCRIREWRRSVRAGEASSYDGACSISSASRRTSSGLV